MRLSVIVPARNEAAALGECLRSLMVQSEAGFSLGEEWELIVVDDDSTDGTREIAQAVAAGRKGMVVIAAPKLDQSERGGFTGKTNACWAGAQRARGEWLLFTDADTVHEPGDLARALHEAKKYGVAMLSYSPRQIVSGFWQRAVMPLVFSELASAYPPKQVSDPASGVAAANGQFLLVEREAYFAVGGHRGGGAGDTGGRGAGAQDQAARSMQFAFAMRRTRWRRGCTARCRRWSRDGRRTWRCCFRNRFGWRRGGCWTVPLFFGLPALALRDAVCWCVAAGGDLCWYGCGRCGVSMDAWRDRNLRRGMWRSRSSGCRCFAGCWRGVIFIIG